MSELNDLFEMEQGDFDPSNYIWQTKIDVPEHPLKKIEVHGTSQKHCQEKISDCLSYFCWRKYFPDWESWNKAMLEAKKNCQKIKS
jgi:hypothetical protein